MWRPQKPKGDLDVIQHTLRSLDELAEHEEERGSRLAKTLADYQAQADKPFDHEARMKDPLRRQTQLNAALDLDKNETQVAPSEDDGALAGNSLQGPSVPPRIQRTSASSMSP